MLLSDIKPFKYLIKESVEKQGKLVIEGLMQVAGDTNGNGRIYPRQILEREVNKLKKTTIAQGNAFGELDHPDSPVVSLKNASHVITDLWWEGNNLMGRVEILNTPFGNIAAEIIKAGYTIGISSRGTGSVTETEDGQVIVNDDFDLVTWDLVSNPSVQKAFMKPVGNLNEGLLVKQSSHYIRLNSILDDILRN